MEHKPDDESTRSVSRNLFWIGVVTLLVGIKLIFSYFIPGLKTPGELILSGMLLLVCTVNIFTLRSRLQSKQVH